MGAGASVKLSPLVHCVLTEQDTDSKKYGKGKREVNYWHRDGHVHVPRFYSWKKMGLKKFLHFKQTNHYWSLRHLRMFL